MCSNNSKVAAKEKIFESRMQITSRWETYWNDMFYSSEKNLALRARSEFKGFAV